MIRHDYRVAGQPVTINVLEHLEDLEPLRAWFRDHGNQIIACDTEGTGLNPYAVDFELRHVQFGDATTGWVLPYSRFARPIAGILNHPGYRFVFHNAPYDVAVFDALGIVDGNVLAARTEDTKIKAHLVDPRPQQEGGVGLGLKPNTAHHVDPKAPDTQSGLHKVFSALVLDGNGDVHDVSGLDTKERAKLRKGLRDGGLNPRTLKVDEGWRHVPLYHHIYTLYAGLDVIYTHRLDTVLSSKIRLMGMEKLATFEHDVFRACLQMQLKGLQIDAPYLEDLGHQFRDEAAAQEAEALKYGVDKVGSPAQLVAAFLEMGEKLRAKTVTGNYKVDKGVLYRLADLSTENDKPLNKRTPNPLAAAVLKAKRAEKWRASYVDKTLSLLDKNGRVHPSIRSLQARTARMSISDPPYQQLPSKDYLVRSGVVGSPGNVVLSTDYDQIEMRVAGAFSGEQKMIDAARRGISQHVITAQAIYGDGFDKATMKREYDIAKMSGFLSIYGGGAPTLQLQSGLPLEKCQEVLRLYREGLPALTQWKREIGRQVLEDALSASELRKHDKCIKLMFEAETDEDKKFWRREASAICRGKYANITTPIGRVLPVEAEFSYKVSNYYVQSTARDVLASSLVRLVDSSLSPGLLLPIHDEVLAEAPEAEAEEYIHEMGRIMTTEFRGVPLSAEGKVHGRSWGDGYKR